MTYAHYISLGSFCSVALELERIGLRDCSSPFDWCLSGWNGVEQLIDTHFENFLEYDQMSQSREEPEHYKNQLGIQFFHDFDKYRPLADQLEEVKAKYSRRIDRFYQNIAEPTLFIRYISGKSEKEYLENNYEKILGKLRAYNENNDIVFIANNDLPSLTLPVYLVEKDENDFVARRFLDKNPQLYSWLNHMEYDKREENLRKFIEKEKKKKSPGRCMGSLCKKAGRKLFQEVYVHSAQY